MLTPTQNCREIQQTDHPPTRPCITIAATDRTRVGALTSCHLGHHVTPVGPGIETHSALGLLRRKAVGGPNEQKARKNTHERVPVRCAHFTKTQSSCLKCLRNCHFNFLWSASVKPAGTGEGGRGEGRERGQARGGQVVGEVGR